MIRVDGASEKWAGRVAQLMAARGHPPERIVRFFRVVGGHPVRQVNPPGHPRKLRR